MPLFGSRDDALEHIDELLTEMLADNTTSLGLARAALFEGADPDEVGPTLRATDKEVNSAEREVRRAVLVHIAVAGPADSPALLTYMSIVKDVERLGDYAKNIFDLATIGADFSGVDDHRRLVDDFDAAVAMVPEAAECFAERDADRAHELLARGERLLSLCNEGVERWATSDQPGTVAVVRALLYRYLKRVVAHTANLLSSVVMPVDRLDYFDEPDRDPDEDPWEDDTGA